MENCIFCKIAAGEIPSTKVYENESVYAFRDINPQAPVHILVIPKEHIGSAAEITAQNSAAVARCFEAIAEIARAEKLDGGFRVISNCGDDAGQTVRHLHFHILAGTKMGEKML
ncbi:MAG: histidine triad nucleotide-binding protein [Oscillospiraceae bacterium]